MALTKRNKQYQLPKRQGPHILNLGCGAVTHSNCINIDWSIYIRLAKNPLLRILAIPFIGKERRQNLRSLTGEAIAHNLLRGIPFPNNSVDAVYHSHVLEHFDRSRAPVFLAEVFRVLKPSGIHRICVPDLEYLVRQYLDNLQACQRSKAKADSHDQFVHAILEQSVRREPYGTSQQPRLRRVLENLILGDARQRGETHQWMYDRINLSSMLSEIGFSDIFTKRYNESAIPDWTEMSLECNASGAEYKPNSLYMECRKPST